MNLSLQAISLVSLPLWAITLFLWYHSIKKENLRVLKKELKTAEERRLKEGSKGIKIRIFNEELKTAEHSLNEEKLKLEIKNIEIRLTEKIESLQDRVGRLEGQLHHTNLIDLDPSLHNDNMWLHRSS